MRTMSRGFLALLMLSPAAWAQTVDLAEVERELNAMFERPAGQRISEAQQANLQAFLERHRTDDLAQFGYARALGLYFQRDMGAAAAALDEFFRRHDRIAHTEHATMAGRIYLSATLGEARTSAPDLEKICRWSERMSALYGDLATVGRAALQVMERVQDPAPLRVAIARGLARSAASDGDKDQLLQTIYLPREKVAPPAADTVATPGQRAAQAPAVEPATDKGEKQPAAAAPLALPVEHVVAGAADFRLETLRGKVVVLDLMASWCPPCRSRIAPLHEAISAYGDRVALVAVTRFYGRGMDFAPGAQIPHGGQQKAGLDRKEEIELYERFAKAFSIDHPIVFTTEPAWRETLRVTVVPTIVVLGVDGKVVGRFEGSTEKSDRDLRACIEQAMAAR